MPQPRAADPVASYSILVDGARIDRQHSDRVREIRVEDSLGLPDVCTVSLGFPRPAKKGDPHLIDSQPFAIGGALEIRLGETDAQTPTAIFKGEILTLEPQFGAGGVELLVRAYDRTHRLHRSRRVDAWTNMTASDIVAKIIGAHGLTADCEPSGDPLEFMQQDNETDWDFIWRLADRVGFELAVDDRTVHFRRPGHGPVVELEWSETLRSFNPRVTAVQQVEEVSLAYFDPISKQAVEVRSGAPEQVSEVGIQRSDVVEPFAGDSMHVATAPVHSDAEGRQLAQALMDRIANGYVNAEGVAPGDPRVRAGVMVDVKGVGQKFGGRYRVHSSTHVLRGGGAYETLFSSFPVNTVLEMLGARNGSGASFGGSVVLAKVTNNSDPEDLGRVKVWYPALGGDHEGTWARVATASAGKERGLLMLPQPDEEVLVAFEHGDTTRPYVVGSLFNGADVPGPELAATDGSFGLRSDKQILVRAQDLIEMSTDKTYTLKVAGDVTQTFEAQMTTTVTSGATLEVKQGTLTIKSGGNVSVEATGNLEMKGAMVSISASAGLTLDGGPMTTVSGGAIQIG